MSVKIITNAILKEMCPNVTGNKQGRKGRSVVRVVV